MNKIEIKQRTVEDRIHHFYCDRCGEFLGSSHEYDNGWYQQRGEFELKIYLLNGWHTSKKCLCDKCKVEYSREVGHVLQELGFKEESRDDLEEEKWDGRF